MEVGKWYSLGFFFFFEIYVFNIYQPTAALSHWFFKPGLKSELPEKISPNTDFKTPLQTYWIRNSKLETLQICVFDKTLQETEDSRTTHQGVSSRKKTQWMYSPVFHFFPGVLGYHSYPLYCLGAGCQTKVALLWNKLSLHLPLLWALLLISRSFCV